jgi:hypothetical protein
MKFTAKGLTAKLLILNLINLLVVCVLFFLKAEGSTVACLRRIVHGQIWTDCSPFIESAWRNARAGNPIYRTMFFEQHVKFLYPPSSIFLGSVAHALGVSVYGMVRLLVLTSGAFTLVFAGEVFLLVLPSDPEDKGYRWKIRLLIAGLGVLFYPLVLGVDLGQVQTFIAFLFTLGTWLWMRDQKSAAGAFLALACIFKPQLALFLLWALVRKQWRFFFTFATVALLIQVLSIGVFGWRNELDYLQVLSYLSHRGVMVAENQTVNGWLQRWLGNGLLSDPRRLWYPPYNRVVYVGTIVSSLVLVLFGLVVPALRRWQATTSDFLLFGMIATVASPIAWIHHYSLFYVASVYFLAVALRQTGRIPVSFAVCFLVMANYFHFFYRYFGQRWISPVFSYLLYAGLAMMLLISFGLDQSQEQWLVATSNTKPV